MPYKNIEDRMQRQKERRDTPKTSKPDTPAIIGTPIDTPSRGYFGLAHLITNPIGKKKLLNILKAFEVSSHPEYMADVRLGVYGFTLADINKLVN